MCETPIVLYIPNLAYSVNRFHMKEFAVNLKKARTGTGLTQRELAEELKVALRTYKNWESTGPAHRMPDVATLIKIADILNVTLDTLVGR